MRCDPVFYAQISIHVTNWRINKVVIGFLKGV